MGRWQNPCRGLQWQFISVIPSMHRDLDRFSDCEMFDTRLGSQRSSRLVRFGRVLCICRRCIDGQIFEKSRVIVQNYRVQTWVIGYGQQNFLRNFVASPDESGKTYERITEARFHLRIFFPIGTYIKFDTTIESNSTSCFVSTMNLGEIQTSFEAVSLVSLVNRRLKKTSPCHVL